MKETGGKANAKVVNERLREKLGASWTADTSGGQAVGLSSPRC
jgi:hypothetical protein